MKSVSIAELFTTGVYLKPLLIMLTLHFIQQFCGINVIVFYLADIFIAAGFDIENSLSSAAIVSLTQVPKGSYRSSRLPVTYLFQVIATGTAVFIVERLGRKLLLMFSSIVMSVSIVALGAFFYLDERKEVICDSATVEPFTTTLSGLSSTTPDPCVPQDGYSLELMESIGWLPLASLIIYKFAFSIGYGPSINNYYSFSHVS